MQREGRLGHARASLRRHSTCITTSDGTPTPHDDVVESNRSILLERDDRRIFTRKAYTNKPCYFRGEDMPSPIDASGRGTGDSVQPVVMAVMQITFQ